MARRNSLFSDLMTVPAKFPWWVGVLLALISYLVFHGVASQPQSSAPTSLDDFGNFTRVRLFQTLATFLQYVVPAAFLFGAVGSLIFRSKKRDSIGLLDSEGVSPSGQGCPT